jgi:rare lipoprotein A
LKFNADSTAVRHTLLAKQGPVDPYDSEWTMKLKSLAAALLLSICGATTMVASAETGLAAVYSHRLDGHKTASGKIYDPAKMTVSHKSLPFGTVIQITNKSNGKTAKATVTDRGPSQPGRVLDVSSAVARRLGMKRGAMTEVDVEKE